MWLGGALRGSLWLCYAGPLAGRKVGSKVIGEDRSQLPGRRTVGEVGGGGRIASGRAKRRVYSCRVRLGQERRASSLPCLSLGLDDCRRSTSGSGDVSLAISITSVSGSKSLTSFINLSFHFSVQPGFSMAFDAVERNGRFGRI